MQISLEEAYAKACQEIGEGIIRERVLKEAIDERDAQLAKYLPAPHPELDLEGAAGDDAHKQQGQRHNGALDQSPSLS